MKLFDIPAQRNLFLYLTMPHFLKIKFMDQADIEAIKKINQAWNKEVSEIYSAEEYDKMHGYTKEQGSGYPLIQLVQRYFPPSHRLGKVLELGAGAGFLTSKLLAQSDRWTAVELAPIFAERLRQFTKSSESRAIEVIEQDIGSLELEDGQFDTIFLFYTLHHLIERKQVVEKIYRWLRKDGILFTLDPRHNLQRVVRIARKYFSNYRKSKHPKLMATHDYVSKIELRQLFKNAGFKSADIQSFDFPLAMGLRKNPAQRFNIESFMNRLPAVEHFGRFIFAKAVK